MKNKKRIYFDYAATTPLDEEVLKKMMPYFKKYYGNASSIHQFGREAAEAIEKARMEAVKFLGCEPKEIIFTGSASESDNLAIKGLVKALRKQKRAGEQVHIITTQIEHKAVLETCKEIEKEGIKVTYLPVGHDGIINLDDLEAEIIPETDLVSVMYANNETGAIQPIKEIGKLIARVNKNKEHRVYFHTDAVQAANWLDCNVDNLGVDLLTLSAHKIYGPKGVGLLYARKGTPIYPLIVGGGQEWKMRAGTENVAAIVGMGEAIKKIRAANWQKKVKIIEKLRNKLIADILIKIEDSRLNTPKDPKKRIPNIANFSFGGVEGEAVVLALDEKGIAASTGSACTSQELIPSHVLIAMGLSHLEAHSSLRISLGKYTTEEEVNYFIKVFPSIIERLRKISGRI